MADYSAITVWQPWATLICEGLKPFEFRGWPAPPRLRGTRIAIHAGARPVKRAEITDLLYKLSRSDWRVTGLVEFGRTLDLLEHTLNAPASLPLSSVLCTAVLGEPVRNAELAAKMGVPWTNDSDRNGHSNWGWPLTDIERLEPFVPARGARGFWTWRREATDAALAEAGREWSSGREQEVVTHSFPSGKPAGETWQTAGAHVGKPTGKRVGKP